MYNSQITQIANILCINFQRVPSIGLLKGCLGIVLFLYHYAHFTKINKYNCFAGELLDYIISCKNRKIQTSFSNGLYGLGWGIKYLQNKEFIDIEEDTLKLFDMMTLQNYSRIEFESDISSTHPLFSRGLYSTILSTQVVLEKTFFNVMTIIKNFENNRMSLSFLTSILYFLNQYEIISKDVNNIAQIKDSIISMIHNSILLGNYQPKELFILNSILHKSNIKMELPKRNIDLLLDVYMNYETIIYDDIDLLSENLDLQELNTFLTYFTSNIPNSMLSLDGICSLGINLIKKSSKMKQ